jgi:hypothetical protein
MLKICGTCFVLTALIVVAFMNSLCLAGEDMLKTVYGNSASTRTGTGYFTPLTRPPTGASSGSRGTSQPRNGGNYGSQSYGTGAFHRQDVRQGAKVSSRDAENGTFYHSALAICL